MLEQRKRLRPRWLRVQIDGLRGMNRSISLGVPAAHCWLTS